MIEFKGVSKVYRNGELEIPVLKNISFKINTGEFVAIMGPSGSGKSTLMNIIGCLDMPTGGQYLFNDKDISSFSDDELAEVRKQKIGFVFQAFNLLPRATVFRNVMLPLVYTNVSEEERRERTKTALQHAALSEDFWGFYSNQLSGGMMQRVAIARALVNDQTIILADEPTGNLDSRTGEMVLHTFQRLNVDEGRAIVLITHESYVAEHAERIIRILDGGIVEDSKVKNRRIISKYNI